MGAEGLGHQWEWLESHITKHKKKKIIFYIYLTNNSDNRIVSPWHWGSAHSPVPRFWLVVLIPAPYSSPVQGSGRQVTTKRPLENTWSSVWWKIIHIQLWCVEEPLTWQVGTGLLWRGAFIAGSDPPLFLVLPVFWGCCPHCWALAMGLAWCLLGCAPCAPCNPVQTAPELWDGSICCLLVLGLSAILQINLAGKSIFLTLSTLIYTTFPMMTSVTNPKRF